MCSVSGIVLPTYRVLCPATSTYLIQPCTVTKVKTWIFSNTAVRTSNATQDALCLFWNELLQSIEAFRHDSRSYTKSFCKQFYTVQSSRTWLNTALFQASAGSSNMGHGPHGTSGSHSFASSHSQAANYAAVPHNTALSHSHASAGATTGGKHYVYAPGGHF